MSHERVGDSWERGDPYEQYVGRWSRRVAPRFLAWLGVAPARRWLDVGCGTGALCGAILDHCAPSAVAGVDPSEGFLAVARARLAGRAELRRGDASSLPLADGAVDVVVSGLVLNFVPDPRRALAEMMRVTASGGTLGAYVWDYGGSMDLMQRFWEVAVALDPNAATLDERTRFPLCRPGALEALFAEAGLTGVEPAAIDIDTPFRSFDDYWRPFLGGQGPAPAYAVALDEPARARLREGLRDRLERDAGGTISMTARALAVRGTAFG
jgi:SAM-dependent methyltransferase